MMLILKIKKLKILKKFKYLPIQYYSMLITIVGQMKSIMHDSKNNKERLK